MKQTLRLWDPESPGMRVTVQRNWLQRMLYPKDFATLGEALKVSNKLMREINARA